MKDAIKKYTQIDGISGNEILVKKELEATFLKGNTEIIYDKLGSIATIIPTKGEATKKIGIFAHMDEVGLMITKIKDNGTIQIINVGGINIDTLVCQRVIYTNMNGNKFPGIIMASSPHLKTQKPSKISDLEVNFGFDSKEAAIKKGFVVGGYVNFIGEFVELENDNIVTKAADNRIACAVVEKLYEEYTKKDNNFELVLGATVQEELGLKGAGTLLNKLDKDFDHIIIVDVSPIDSMDHIKLGAGPLLRIAEPRGVYDVIGNRELRELCQKLKINVQDYFSKGRTDGAQMQITNSGYKVNALCVPACNLHTNSTVFNIKDVKAIMNILEGYFNEI